MQIQARFKKVSYSQFKDYGSKEDYDIIKLPQRATRGSAGYDFFAPTEFTLEPKQSITIATGIRAVMPPESDYFLAIFPRSGLGFKYKLRLDNTVGIIDADYWQSDNEGHIFIRMTNESDKTLHIDKGSAFAQGIFMSAFTTADDDATERKRNGGLGSTDVKNKD